MEEKTVIIRFPPPAKPLNMNERLHWSQRARRTKAWRQAAATAAMAIKKSQRGQPPSTVSISLPVRSLKVRRDPSNWAPTLKAAIDGLIDAGVFPDDDSRWVTTFEPAFHLGSQDPDAVMTIERRGS